MTRHNTLSGFWTEHTHTDHDYQIMGLSCNSCDFSVSPNDFRHMGNYGRVSHSRKLMRDHVRAKHLPRSAEEIPNA